MSEVHPEVRRLLLADYLRPSCPTAISCIHRTLLLAADRQLPVPTHYALERLLTALRRDSAEIVALSRSDAISADAFSHGASVGRRGSGRDQARTRGAPR